MPAQFLFTKKARENTNANAMPLKYATHQSRLEKLTGYGGFFCPLLLATTYFSTSLSTIMSIIVGLVWLISAQFKSLLKILRQHSVAGWAFALFLCFIIGTSYGTALPSEAASMVKKYREFLFIPVLIPFLSQKQYRDWSWKTFILASVLTLIGSYGMEFGFFGAEKQLEPSFKSRITHSIFIAYFAFFCLHQFMNDLRYRWLYLALFCFALVDLFFVVQGRTGQLIVLALILLFALQQLNLKGRMLTALIIILSLSLFVTFSDKANRIFEGVDNTRSYLNHQDESKTSSMGLRYRFWENSLKLVSEKPWLGHGTGGFAEQYKRVSDNHPDNKKNPHNEFLLITVQLGLFGLFIYTGFLLSQFYSAKSLPDREKNLAQGLLLTLVITSLFNSPFLDHTEGHWFGYMIALCHAPQLSQSVFRWTLPFNSWFGKKGSH